jgi:GlpG protein
MRQLVTLPRDQAHLLADHLLTLNIQTQLADEPAGVAIWVRDEDNLPRARRELETFQKNPTDPRYRDASRTARVIRERSEQDDVEYEEQQKDFTHRMRNPNAPVAAPIWTVLMVIVCVLVAAATQMGEDRKSPVLKALWLVQVTPDGDRWAPQGEGFSALTERGQWWRLVTPIFIHLGPLHFVFNMLALVFLGRAVESRIGNGAFLGLVLLIAVPSNLAQAFFQFGLNVPGVFSFEVHPLFGGMSGVIYGLFGFLWVRSWTAEIPEAVMPPQVVSGLLVWLVICILGAIGAVANTAHVVGLLIGMGVGWLTNLATR